MSVLYVGLTRARHALHLMVYPFPNAVKKLTQKLSHRIRAAVLGLAPLGPSRTHTITGSAEWRDELAAQRGEPEGKDHPAPAEKAAAGGNAEPLVIRLAPSVRSAGRMDDAVAPSQHAEVTRNVYEVVRPAGEFAMARGTLLHAWFEQIQFLEDGVPAEASLRRIARGLEPHSLNIQDCLAAFHTALRQPKIAWILSRRAYLSPDGPFARHVNSPQSATGLSVTVRNERRVLTPRDGDGGLVNGVIDRLILLRRGDEHFAADLVDYKTDVLHELDAAARDERLARYREQLNLYAKAVAVAYSLPLAAISARLIFTASGHEEIVR